jgi:hypothetical protein
MNLNPFKKKIQKCSFDAEMHLEAADGKTPQFRMSPAYNGGKLPVRGFDAPVIVELATARFEKDKIKINAYHDQDKTVGHAEHQEINAEGIFIDGLLSKVNDDVNRIVAEAKNNFPHEASIEASFPPAEFVKPGRSVKVNGAVQKGPFYLARNAVITGVAILDRGADRHTEVSIAAELSEKEFDMKLEELFAKHGIDPSADDAVEKLTAALAPKAEKKNEDEVPVAELADVQTMTAEEATKLAKEQIIENRKKLVDERNRVGEIERICARYDNPEVKIDDKLVDLQSHAIEAGLSIDEVKIMALQHEVEKKTAGGRPGIHDATKEDMNVDVIECALAMSAGLTEQAIRANKFYDEKVVDIAVGSRYRGMRPSELAQRTFIAAGMPSHRRLNNDYIRSMQAADQKLQASGFTTLSIPGILSNVMNKTLMAAYQRQESFIPFVFGVTSAQDFKPMYSYQLEGEGRLETLGKDNEIKHGSVVESSYTKSLETYAKLLSWTRKDMINDDLGSLNRTVDMLGTMAFKAREFAAAQFVVTPGAGWWETDVNSFASVDLGIAGLTTSEEKWMAITDSDGLPISVNGGNILVPPPLKIPAMQLANDTEIRELGASAKVYYTKNPHAGTFSYLSTPWINNAVVTSAAAKDKTWYRFADPTVAPALEVMYLNGVSTPTIESDQTCFNTLGMQFRCYFDFGFGANDKKYAQRLIGA